MPKSNTFLNLNLFTGSTERMRNGLQRVFYVSDEGELVFKRELPINIHSVKTSDVRAAVGETSIFPSLRLSNRIIGDSESYENDEEWKTFCIGGTYANKLYFPFYSSKIFYDHSNRYSLPYSSTETKHLISEIPDISITGEYYNHYRTYQNDSTRQTSILSLPNFYYMEGDLFYPTKDEDYLFTFKYNNLNSYIEDYYLQDRIPNIKLKNIFVNNSETTLKIKNQGVPELNEEYSFFDKIYSLMPYGTKILIQEQFCSQGGTVYKDFIKNNSLESLFTRIIKESYDLQTQTEVEDISVVSNTVYERGMDKISHKTIKETKENKVRSIKLKNLLMNCIRNPTANSQDMSYLDEAYTTEKFDFLSSLDTSGIYKTDNIKKIFIFLSFLRDRMKSSLDRVSTLNKHILSNRIETDENYYEPILFRVEKIGGSPAGDNRSDSVLQNIWFFNHDRAIEYFDSQIKYNKSYTYKIYSYVIVEGLRYQTTNLSLTKLIATDETEGGLDNCLEFYDPYTLLRSEQLFSSENISNTTGTDGQVINQLASNSQINSKHRYIADFYSDLESDIRILEIPLVEKTVNIIDHPTNKVIVEPNYYRDNSKKVAFLLKNDVFNYDYLTYPTTVSPIDDQNRDLYLQNKDMIITDKLKERTVSDIRTIECFRLDSKPQSYKDFNNAFKTIIDLKDRNTGDIYSDSLLVQQVIPNKKYYYTFRSVNENGISGHLSPIYETILVSDGGYNYATFKQIYEEELIENRASKISIPIKKLLNIVPNFRHLQINFSDLNYSEKSHEQIDRVVLGKDIEEPIWDNSFKFRLTSEKTKRVFDINIHFDKK